MSVPGVWSRPVLRAVGVAVAATAVWILGSLASPAVAVACPSAGGTPTPFDTDPDVTVSPGDVVVNGGGWGHGIGMSQYGAKGAALLGCDHAEILRAYYPGTTLATRPSPSSVAVHLREAVGPGASTSVRTASGGPALPWVACDLAAGSCPTVAVQPGGATWRVVAHGDGSFELVDASTGASRWRGGDLTTRLRLRHDGTVVRVLEARPSSSHPAGGLRVRWGFLEFDYTGRDGGRTYVTSYVTGGASGRSAVDTYLLGLGEVPTSWPREAQAAQAVAARSYAAAAIRNREAAHGRHPEGGYIDRGTGGCRCDLVATVSDQFWLGYDREAASGAANWAAAVSASRDRYVMSGSSVASTFYSSSHGGASDASRDIWSADLSYLRSVDTSRWEAAAGNPYQRWTKVFSRVDLARRFGLDEFVSIEVTERLPGGRPAKGGVAVTGRRSGKTVVLRYGSEEIRSRLGLRSGNIRVGDGAYGGRLAPVARFAGAERIATSVRLAANGWTSARTVVLARADDPADALAGAALAGLRDAPLLITERGRLSAAVASELRRLAPSEVVLLGAAGALSDDVAAGVRATLPGATVSRLGGANRYETAAQIARAIGPSGVAYIVPGADWADALTVAGLAARMTAAGSPRPVLLSDGSLHAATDAALREAGVHTVLAIGGRVGQSVLDDLAARGVAVRRVAGPTRYHTSVEVAKLDTLPARRIVAATGRAFPDGLSAGPYAARMQGRLLIVPPDSLPPVQESFVRSLGWDDPELVVAGGRGAVGHDTAMRLQATLGANMAG